MCNGMEAGWKLSIGLNWPGFHVFLKARLINTSLIATHDILRTEFNNCFITQLVYKVCFVIIVFFF